MEQLTAFFKKNQPIIYQQLHNSFKHGRLSHAYLFEGVENADLEKMVTWTAQAFFCTSPVEDGDPCGECSNCRRIKAGEHPDVLWIKPDGNSIKVDQIRDLQDEFGKSGLESTKRAFIISDAEKMSISAANSLLKFLEDPQVDSLALLTTTALGKILPTIQSRVQVMNLLPPDKATLKKILAEETGWSGQKLDILTTLSNSKHDGIELSADQWFNDASDSVLTWMGYLAKGDAESFVAVQAQLVPLFKEKSQQILGFELLFFVLLYSALSYEKKAQVAELFLTAQVKFQSNVSFQNVLEQATLLALQTLSR